MKVIKFIKKCITVVLITAFLIVAIVISVLLLSYNRYGVSQFGNTSLVIIREEISSDKYKKGDLVFVESKGINRLKSGDEIFIYLVDRTGIVRIDIGIVDEVDYNKQEITFNNGSTYASKFLIGKATKVYKGVGAYLAVIQSKWGFLFMILIPCFLLFISQLYALIVEIKYGDEKSGETKTT